MQKMLQEIRDIPGSAFDFLENSGNYHLPKGVPYLGMGSSYFAPLAFKYMNKPVLPELASEYYYYHRSGSPSPEGVILSQSGQSSEALWCTRLLDRYTAITNHPDSELATSSRAESHIDLRAGKEEFSSSKTYINTLLALFKGLGMDPLGAVGLMKERMDAYEAKGKEMAEEVHHLISDQEIHGIYITGSGPNIATACEASLILSESTKRTFTALPMAQYDHGPKETSAGSIVIQILASGPAYRRTVGLGETIRKAGARLLTVEEPGIGEHFSVLHHMVPFNFMAYYLAALLGISETFVIGGKVTETE